MSQKKRLRIMFHMFLFESKGMCVCRAKRMPLHSFQIEHVFTHKKNWELFWVFPKIMVPPNHPILIGFPL